MSKVVPLTSACIAWPERMATEVSRWLWQEQPEPGHPVAFRNTPPLPKVLGQVNSLELLSSTSGSDCLGDFDSGQARQLCRANCSCLSDSRGILRWNFHFGDLLLLQNNTGAARRRSSGRFGLDLALALAWLVASGTSSSWSWFQVVMSAGNPKASSNPP